MGKNIKRVISGHLSHEDIDQIIIIDLDRTEAIYAGTPEKWKNTCDLMTAYRNEIEETMEVVKSQVDCGRKLFLYVKEKEKEKN